MSARCWMTVLVLGMCVPGLSRAQEIAPTDDGAAALAPQPAAPAASDDVDAGAKEILRSASEAVAGAKSLSFDSTTSYTGFLQGISYATRATVRMVRPAEGSKQWRLRTAGSGSKKEDQPPQAFDVLWDSGVATWLDDGAKKLMERPKGQARGVPVQMAASSFLTQFEEATPFSKELAAEVIALEGSENVGGVSCDIVSVRSRTRKGVTRLWIATSDRIPRKFERASESATYASATIIELTNVKVNEPIPAQQIEFVLPEGYTKDSTIVMKPTPAPPPATSEGAVPETADDAASATVPAASVASRGGARAAEQVPAAPDFELFATDGSKVRLSELRGKPVLLFFWGTWSLPSQAAELAVQVMHEKFSPAGLRVLALPVREKSEGAPEKFVRDAGHTYSVLKSADGVAKLYGITVYPTFVVVDAEGNTAGRIDGWRKDETAGKLADEIGKLLPEVRNSADPAPDQPEASGSAAGASPAPGSAKKPD